MSADEITRVREHERYMRIAVTVLGGFLAAFLVALGLLIANQYRLLDQQTALATALDTSRSQVVALGATPVVPPADKVIENPSVVSTPQAIDPAALQDAALVALDKVLPYEVSTEVEDAVAEYVRGCVASGECVGPQGTPGTTGTAGLPGADGRTPGPDDVADAVLAVCHTELDCEVTPDEVAQAVADYCGLESQPCGHTWTLDEIYKIAIGAAQDYVATREFWCPPEDTVPNGQPFGPCHVK